MADTLQVVAAEGRLYDIHVRARVEPLRSPGVVVHKVRLPTRSESHLCRR